MKHVYYNGQRSSTPKCQPPVIDSCIAVIDSCIAVIDSCIAVYQLVGL